MQLRDFFITGNREQFYIFERNRLLVLFIFLVVCCTALHSIACCTAPHCSFECCCLFFFTIFVSFFAFTQLIVRINFHKEINLHRNVINGFACEFDMDFGNCLKLKIFDGRKWYMVKQYRCSCFNVQSEKQTH